MEFLDEMNNIRQTNTSFITQPITRQQAFTLLQDIDEAALNERQKKELLFYKRSFSKDQKDWDKRPEAENSFSGLFCGLDRVKQPDLLYLKKAKTTLTVNPIIGMSYMSNENGANWQRRVGGDFQANIGNIGIYGNVRDVYEFKPLAFDSLATPKEGSLYKRNADGSAEFSETRGGITYGFEGGYIGLVRDHVRWGYGNFGSNILDIN
ncbi:MAG: hypothetical protein WEC59_01275, partial [Salibacteraceae bacterium]